MRPINKKGTIMSKPVENAVVIETPVEESPKKKFNFAEKKTAIYATVATTVAAVAVIAVIVKTKKSIDMEDLAELLDEAVATTELAN